MSEQYTPEQIAKFTQSRALEDARLIQDGAEYESSETGEPLLRLTPEQKDALENEEKESREKKTELGRRFSIPDQTEELNFKKFLDGMLFHSYILPDMCKRGNFGKMVYETSQPFNGIKGREFQEIIIKKEAGDKAVRAERGDFTPISLNEWRYLFTQLTEEQLLGTTYYYVQFDDGAVRSIEAHFSRSGGGPYGYSLEVQKLSPQDSFHGNIAPRIIVPVAE